MTTLRRLYTGYGNIPQCGGQGPDPNKLAELGLEYIDSYFPKCDIVKKAWRRVEQARAGPFPTTSREDRILSRSFKSVISKERLLW